MDKNQLFPELYEIRDSDKEFFGNNWIYKESHLKQSNNLVAKEEIHGQEYRYKIEYYIWAGPARSIEIHVSYGKEKKIIFSTGTGNPTELFTKLKPMIEMIKEDMLGIKIE